MAGLDEGHQRANLDRAPKLTERTSQQPEVNGTDDGPGHVREVVERASAHADRRPLRLTEADLRRKALRLEEA
ncbi:MAG: hypothetical protein R3C15_02340 [Thermoleophilia bacterium]